MVSEQLQHTLPPSHRWTSLFSRTQPEEASQNSSLVKAAATQLRTLLQPSSPPHSPLAGETTGFWIAG